MDNATIEQLSGGVRLYVSDAHKFGTDAFLLAHFAAPRRKDACCDLGSGCGIIPFIWCDVHKPVRVAAVELQREAAALIERSVKLNGLTQTVTPVMADLRALDGLVSANAFDVVSCNPPYKAADTGIISETHSDRIARHETMCTIADVVGAAARLLRFGGRLCVCQRPERLCDVLEAMRAGGIEPKRLRFVQQRADTAPWLFLAEGKKGARRFLKVEPPFIIEGPGGFSRELLDCYGKKDNLPGI
ncbi:MAG: tRNA1(Val) (adenine(37)-N6)-methyltransferase [Acetanaerobacterium sp.]